MSFQAEDPLLLHVGFDTLIHETTDIIIFFSFEEIVLILVIGHVVFMSSDELLLYALNEVVILYRFAVFH